MSKKAGLILENELQYSINALLAYSIMSEEPLIIVEGMDDVEFYKKIAPDNFKVKSSDMIQKSDETRYVEGCEGVLQIILDIQTKIQKDPRIEKFFLGIIDGDYRKFKDDNINGLKCLFILKYYSFESHFVTDRSIIEFVSSVTRADIKDITKEVLEILNEGVDEIKMNLYYAGLEALKGCLYKNYLPIVSYDKAPEALYQHSNNNKTIMDEVLAKKEELEQFAKEMNVSKKQYLNIARGKWLLYSFAKKVYNNIEKVKTKCIEGQIEQCDYCRQGITRKCIWGKSEELTNKNYVHKMIYSNLNEPQIQYIKEQFDSLG